MFIYVYIIDHSHNQLHYVICMSHFNIEFEGSRLITQGLNNISGFFYNTPFLYYFKIQSSGNLIMTIRMAEISGNRTNYTSTN